MSIATSRFEGLHKDFNVASESFASIRDATESVINSAEDFIELNTEPLRDMVDQLKEMKQEAVESATDLLEKATRFTDDMFGTFTDLAALPGEIVDGLIKDLIPDESSAIAKGLAGIIKTCKSNAGRGLGGKKKFKPPSCEGMSFGTKNCSNSNTAGVLGGLLGDGLGLLNKAISVFDAILKKIVSLASMGFAAGLCGVFSALIDSVVDKSIVTLAAGTLLNAEGVGGNMQAVFDIGKNLSGINVPAMFPSTISNIAQNMTAPLSFIKNGIGQFADSVTGTLEAIDPDFLGVGAIASIASLGKKNSVLDKVLSWGGNNLSLTDDNLNDVFSSRESDAAVVYSSLSDFDVFEQQESFDYM